jgi:hypothetical protein
MLSQLRLNDIGTWTHRFLNSLEAVRQESSTP